MKKSRFFCIIALLVFLGKISGQTQSKADSLDERQQEGYRQGLADYSLFALVGYQNFQVDAGSYALGYISDGGRGYIDFVDISAMDGGYTYNFGLEVSQTLWFMKFAYRGVRSSPVSLRGFYYGQGLIIGKG